MWALLLLLGSLLGPGTSTDLCTDEKCCCRGYDCNGRCPSLNTLDISIKSIYVKQPLCTVLAPLLSPFLGADNVCLTFIPQPDSPDIYIQYRAIVRTNSSDCRVTTSIIKQMAPGRFIESSPYSKKVLQYIGYVPSCKTYVVFCCYQCGVDCVSYAFGVSFDCKAKTPACTAEVNVILAANKLPPVTLIELPYMNDNACVTRRPSYPCSKGCRECRKFYNKD